MAAHSCARRFRADSCHPRHACLPRACPGAEKDHRGRALPSPVETRPGTSAPTAATSPCLYSPPPPTTPFHKGAAKASAARAAHRSSPALSHAFRAAEGTCMGVRTKQRWGQTVVLPLSWNPESTVLVGVPGCHGRDCYSAARHLDGGRTGRTGQRWWGAQSTEI